MRQWHGLDKAGRHHRRLTHPHPKDSLRDCSAPKTPVSPVLLKNNTGDTAYSRSHTILWHGVYISNGTKTAVSSISITTCFCTACHYKSLTSSDEHGNIELLHKVYCLSMLLDGQIEIPKLVTSQAVSPCTSCDVSHFPVQNLDHSKNTRNGYMS